MPLTRQLNIKRAKPLEIEWEALKSSDLFYTGWSELLEVEPPTEPRILSIRAWSHESISGEELFKLWKLEMIRLEELEIQRHLVSIAKLKKFGYLQPTPENFS